MCEEIIARVIRQAPDMAGSHIAVVATQDPNRPLQRGGDDIVLVAFAPFDSPDYRISKRIWTVTQPMGSTGWRVDPWRGTNLPAHFVALLRAAGIDS